MRGTTGQARLGRLGGGWSGLAWKLLLAAGILLLMSVGSPLSWAVTWGFLNPIPATLILWGGLVVGIASSNLFEGDLPLRIAWGALAVGAYGALVIPGVLIGPDKMAQALGPVTALTLAAHLGRRDLPRALRDWAFVMALAIYAGLGVQAMWHVINSFGNRAGPLVFLAAVVLPPLVFEGAQLVLRRIGVFREGLLASAFALLLATAVAVSVVSATMLNVSTALPWRIVFALAAGVLIGGALLIGLATRLLVAAASGALAARGSGRGTTFGRALVELSHEPVIISLVVYIPLLFLSVVGAP
jgi:hypothetical protein